ncbi:unnamed protein product [Diatraea saccharalis]|uniref:FLYWCH-type domain-containing protein n=1 Tax=Diatraea saccharalis TaxID=40085 RepID=A0A9N9R0F7_9NEOP|nr:unnamed protein product [Diatraea saccharalis]
MMIIGGYRFSLQYARNTKERWQCSRRSYYGCKAVVRLNNGVLRYRNVEHNHEP